MASAQDHALTSLYNHLRSVYGGHSKPDFNFVAKQCDDAGIPYWVQNNCAIMAEHPEVHHRNSLRSILAASYKTDWRTGVDTGDK